MADILERIQNIEGGEGPQVVGPVLSDAHGEIERLRFENTRLIATLKDLRQQVSDLIQAIDGAKP